MVDWYVQVPLSLSVQIDLLDLYPGLKLVQVASTWPRGAGDSRWAMVQPLGEDHRSADLASKAREAVRESLVRANEALAADSPLPRELIVGAYVWTQDPDDPSKALQYAFVEAPGVAIGISTAGAIGKVDGVAQTPPRTQGHRSRELAENNPNFAKALQAFAEAGTDIRKLWIPFEYVKEAFPRSLAGLGGVSDGEVKAFGETANERGIRHKPRRKPPSHPEVSADDARLLVGRLLSGWLERENPR